jgi:hypothetical protein
VYSLVLVFEGNGAKATAKGAKTMGTMNMAPMTKQEARKRQVC